jgi:predicted site-specific integrase-resolvase
MGHNGAMKTKTLKTRQVAKIFGVKVTTIQNWIGRRKIDAIREDNGRWAIPVSEVARLLKTEKVKR